MATLEPGTPTDVTELLETWKRHGQREDFDRLVVALHADLRRVARGQMARERAGHTLQVTALVNEAYLRLVDQRRTDWQNRAHFLAIAAVCMHRVLASYARRRSAAKRPRHPVPLDDVFTSGLASLDDVLPVSEALERLAALDARQARMVEMRVFGGLTLVEIAEAIGVSLATVKRELHSARAFLRAHLARLSP